MFIKRKRQNLRQRTKLSLLKLNKMIFQRTSQLRAMKKINKMSTTATMEMSMMSNRRKERVMTRALNYWDRLRLRKEDKKNKRLKLKDNKKLKEKQQKKLQLLQNLPLRKRDKSRKGKPSLNFKKKRERKRLKLLRPRNSKKKKQQQKLLPQLPKFLSLVPNNSSRLQQTWILTWCLKHRLLLMLLTQLHLKEIKVPTVLLKLRWCSINSRWFINKWCFINKCIINTRLCLHNRWLCNRNWLLRMQPLEMLLLMLILELLLILQILIKDSQWCLRWEWCLLDLLIKIKLLSQAHTQWQCQTSCKCQWCIQISQALVTNLKRKTDSSERDITNTNTLIWLPHVAHTNDKLINLIYTHRDIMLCHYLDEKSL